MNRLILIITFLLYTAVSSAQQPYSYAINDNTGLPSNEVYDLYQDDLGFMWMGTNSGLFKYDGTDFIPVKNTRQTGKAISHLTVAPDQKIWCQNFSGQIFSVQNNSLTQEYDWSNRKRNFPSFTFQGKNIFITGDSGIYCLDVKTRRQLKLYTMQMLAGPKPVYELVEVEAIDKRIYFSEKSTTGFIENDVITVLKSSYSPYPESDVIHGTSFHKVGSHTYLLVRATTFSSVWEVKNDSMIWLRNLPAGLGRVFSAFDDTKGRWWIAGSKGVYCLSYNLQEQYTGKIFFPEKSVSRVLLDKESNYWFSTLQDGILIVPGTEVWLHTETNSGLADMRIRQLATDGKGNLYIGYQNGMLSKYNTATGNTTTVSFPNSPTDIQALLYRNSGELVVAQGKTWSVSIENMQARMLTGISNVKALAETGEDNLVAGAVTGGILFNPVAPLKHFTNLRSKRVRAVLFSKQDSAIWVAYVDGIYTYKQNKETEIRVNGQPLYGTDIAQTQNGVVWIGTVANGLFGFKNGLQVAPPECTLPNGFVRKLAADKDVLWIAAEDRLICCNIKTGDNKTYNKFDGLPSYEIADIEFAAGKIWLATPKGLVEIPDEFNAINKVAPSVFISGFAVHERDTILVDSYTLPFADNNIRISFKGIAFRSQGEFTYRYRLVGLDTSWVTTNSRSNFARYPSLPAGSYTFEVVALNEDEISSSHPAVVRIEILKPFWQTWWFYVLCGLALVTLVSAAFMLRIRYIRRKNELEKRVVNSQLAAIKSQMNPHFMFNALNSIQDLVLQQDTGNAQLYLGKFSELTRRVLEASGKEFVSLQQETDMLYLYLDLEKLRFGNDFRYRLTVDAKIDMDEAHVPSMIIQPFVENALKHGLLHKEGSKLLTVDFGVQENVLICVIDDNGIGRKASAEINARRKRHTSFAGEATAERLRLLNELHGMRIDLTVIDKEQGTSVAIKIPLQHEGHYSR